MKRIFFTGAVIWFCGCSNSSPNVSTNKDTVTPQGATGSTPNNPGGLQPTGTTTPNGTNTGSADTGKNGINTMSHDSTRR